MKTYSISPLARACGLSRSTLLYYDRLGLLKPSGRTGSGYRYYTDADQRRLERIGHFRQAGLTLKEIRAVLSSGGKPGTRLLETRLRETVENIVGLKKQQRLLGGMLRQVAAGKGPPSWTWSFGSRCWMPREWTRMRAAVGTPNSSAAPRQGTRNSSSPSASRPARWSASSAGAAEK